MKMLPLILLVASPLAIGSVKSLHEKIKVTCTYRSVQQNNHSGPETRIFISESEHTSILNHEKTEETTIWRNISWSENGKPQVLNDAHGIMVSRYTKISETKRKVHLRDSSEYIDYQGNPHESVFENEYTFNLLADANGIRTEEMIYDNDGKEVKALRVKYYNDPNHIRIETYYLNPESLDSNDTKKLFSHRSCEYKKI